MHRKFISNIFPLIVLFLAQTPGVQAEELSQMSINRYLADVPPHVERTTALMYIALRFEDYSLLERAIRSGADVNYNKEKGIPTPLCVAARIDQIRFMQTLLDSGAEAALVHEGEQPGKQTALNCAVNFGEIEAVELLLDWGAEISRKRCEQCPMLGQGSALQDALISSEYGMALQMVNTVALTEESASVVIYSLERHVSSYSNQHEEPNRHKLARYMRDNGYEFDLVKCADALNSQQIKCLDE